MQRSGLSLINAEGDRAWMVIACWPPVAVLALTALSSTSESSHLGSGRWPQNHPRSASWNALRALSNIKKVIPKKKLFPSLIKNIFVRPILKCHTYAYAVLYSIHPPQRTMTVI